VECLMHTLRTALGDGESRPCERCSLCRPVEAPPQPVASPSTVQLWLTERTVPIAATRRPAMAQGLALLDGQLRTQLFVQFMRERAVASPRIPPELEALLLRSLEQLARQYDLQAVVPLPSRTWAHREEVTRWIAEQLERPCLSELLAWNELPASRHGELLNNDQRRENVTGKMTVAQGPHGADPDLGRGALLLVDDYLGSGNTLKEAARALRQEGHFQGELVPLTFARLKWRLGAPGVV